MIHGVRIEGGRAKWYRNRWVRTDSFVEDFPLYNADGTRNLRASIANTHVVNHAGKTLALVESSLPYEITNDLETVGAYDFGGKLVDSMTAHPKICPTTGELHFFGYGNIFAPHVTYHRADANGELAINRPLDVKALTMMHDFALTANHVVFMDLPIVFNLDVAIKRRPRHAVPVGRRLRRAARGAPARRPVRRGAMVRDRSVLRVPRRECPRLRRREINCAAGGSVSRTVAKRRWLRRRRGAVDVDDRPAAGHRQPSASSTTAPSSSLASTTGWPGCPRATRYQSARRRGCVTTCPLARPSSHRTAASAVRARRCSCRRPRGPRTKATVGISVTSYDPARDGSDLVIVDASDFTGEPVATIKLPHRVPYGFHGNWIAG